MTKDEEDFLVYVEIHSRTELALFHREQVDRLCGMADIYFMWYGPVPVFISVPAYIAEPMVRAARERLQT